MTERIEDMIRAADANVERQREKEELLHAMAEVLRLEQEVCRAVGNGETADLDALLARYAALYPEGART